MNENETQKQAARLVEALVQLSGGRSYPTIQEWVLEYQPRKMASSELRDSTKRAFEYQIRRNILPGFGALPLNKIGNVNWNAWVNQTRASEHPACTRFFNVRKTLLDVLHAAQEEGILDRIPKLDNPDQPRQVGRVMTEEEFWKMMRNTTYRIFRLFFFVLWKQGCRPREILRWRWQHIEWKEPGHTWIYIPAEISKTGRTRKIALNPLVSKHLYRIYQRGVTSEWVFPNRIHPGKPQLSYHGAFRTALMKAKLTEHTVPYNFRRTLITNAMASGKKPVYVAKQLDTSVDQIERTYAKPHIQAMEEVVQ